MPQACCQTPRVLAMKRPPMLPRCTQKRDLQQHKLDADQPNAALRRQSVAVTGAWWQKTRVVARSFAGLATVAATLALGACSASQWYGASQAWQRNQCIRLEDTASRQQCLQKAATPYDTYQREAEAAKTGR